MLRHVVLATGLLRLWGLGAFSVLFICLYLGAGAERAFAKSRYKKSGTGPRLSGRRQPVTKYPPLRDSRGAAVDLKVSGGVPKPPGPPAGATAQATRFADPAQQQPSPQQGLGRRSKRGAARLRPPTDSEILDEAQEAYVDGARQHAIDLALTVAEKDGEMSEAAWRFIGLAACSVRSQRLATRAYQNLRAANDQRTITNACKVNGLAYRNDQFVAD